MLRGNQLHFEFYLPKPEQSRTADFRGVILAGEVTMYKSHISHIFEENEIASASQDCI